MGSAFVAPTGEMARSQIRDRVVDEALGKSLDLIVPERQRKPHWDGWERVMSTGESKYGSRDVLAVPAIHADGTRISLEFSIAMHREPGGRIAGISAILRDVTKRWHADRALRTRLRELQNQQDDPVSGTA